MIRQPDPGERCGEGANWDAFLAIFISFQKGLCRERGWRPRR